MAPFVKDSISSVVDRVIVCETRENRWIAQSEDKSDPADASRLARLLRMGEYKEVHVPGGAGLDRRETLRMYNKIVRDVVRTKNRIKSKYREHGVLPKGDSVYSESGRASWLQKVSRPQSRFLLEMLYQELDVQESIQEGVQRNLLRLMRKTREFKLLLTIPGVGKVTASTIAAIIDQPDRFDGKRSLWKYSSLSVRRRWSGDPGRAKESASPSGNRLMKYAAMTAANSAIRGDNRFGVHYHKMLSEGIDPAMAKKTVARQILATALAMLKSGERYRDCAGKEARVLE
jgi:transposase